MKIKRRILQYLFLILWPLICSLIFIFGQSPMYRALFVLLIIYGYLTVDIIPQPVSSIMIFFLGPLLYIEKTSDITSVYFSTAGLSLSAMFSALTLQYSGLHERFTFWLILKFGTTPRKIMCALIIVSHIISMWLSNTFTVNLMIPVAMKIYENTVYYKPAKNVTEARNEIYKSWVNLGMDSVMKREKTSLGIAYIFAIILGAIAGGLCYARGSPTNITFLIIYADRIKCYLKTDIWFLFTIPISIILTIINCLWLQIRFLGLFKIKVFQPMEDIEQYEKALEKEKIVEALYEGLGPITFHEILVGFSMVLYVILWVSREPYHYDGWQSLLTVYRIQDTATSLFIAFIMMILPADFAIFSCSRIREKHREMYNSYGLVTWLTYQLKINWGDFFVIGCVNLLGMLQNKYGIGKFVATKFVFMKNWPLSVVIIVTSFVITWLSELTMSVVMSSIFSPILIDLAIELNFHPMSISFICCLCYSLSFVYSRGARSVRLLKTLVEIDGMELFKAGILPKMMSYIIVIGFYLLFGKATFYKNELEPDWIYVEDECYCWPCGKNDHRNSVDFP